MTRVYNVVKQKVAAEPKIAEETTNSKINDETKEEDVKKHESTVLCKFVSDFITEVHIFYISIIFCKIKI